MKSWKLSHHICQHLLDGKYTDTLAHELKRPQQHNRLNSPPSTVLCFHRSSCKLQWDFESHTQCLFGPERVKRRSSNELSRFKWPHIFHPLRASWNAKTPLLPHTHRHTVELNSSKAYPNISKSHTIGSMRVYTFRSLAPHPRSFIDEQKRQTMDKWMCERGREEERVNIPTSTNVER